MSAVEEGAQGRVCGEECQRAESAGAIVKSQQAIVKERKEKEISKTRNNNKDMFLRNMKVPDQLPDRAES